MSSSALDSGRADDASDSSLSRSELVLLLLLILAGLGLRIALPARMAVEHFDEGVYASNIFSGGEKDGHYPGQHFYAPPLVPLLIELTMLAFGPSNDAAMGVGIVAGCLTIPLVWWVGRRWFGPSAGLVAATLAALSDVHVLCSRTALTDVLLCFFLTAAVYCFWVAQTSSSRLAIFASGLFTGLAWWTKYNGWLALAIGFAGVVSWRLVSAWMRQRAARDAPLGKWQQAWPLVRSLLIWGGVAIVALAVWGPFWWSLQSEGGYAAVAANHRNYVVGFAGWGASFGAQARKLSLLSGPLTGCSCLVALVLSLVRLRVAGSRFTWNALLRNDVIYIAVPVLGLLCVIEGGAVILASLGVIGAIIALTRAVGRNQESIHDCSRRGLAPWLLVAWLGGLLVSVPFYTPYPRLLLPLLMASWLGVGALAEALIREIEVKAQSRGAEAGLEPWLARRRPGSRALARAKPMLLLAVGLGIAVSLSLRSHWGRGIIGWQQRAELAGQAPKIRDDVARDAGVDLQSGLDRFVIYTYGEPALFFHLRRSGCVFVKPVKDVVFAYPDARTPVLASYFAFGPQAWRTEGFGEQLAKALPRLHLVGKYRYKLSDVVMLDGPLIQHDRRPDYEFEVYRVK